MRHVTPDTCPHLYVRRVVVDVVTRVVNVQGSILQYVDCRYCQYTDDIYLSSHLIEEVLLQPGLAVSVLHQLFVDLQTLE